jgi:predicted ribosome quality control (RQC) complex YloA/Tae2 family protein
MMTDWLIVRRLAAELDRATRGARVREAGLDDDGRFALRLPRTTLAIDAFGPTPILTLDERGFGVRDVPGWSRAIAKAIEGMKIDAVRARRGDRLVAIDLSAQSRFGVATAYRLVCELVPRFGNVLLLKHQTIVAAAKEFDASGAASRATRTILAGGEYEPPPLPIGDVADDARERLTAALRAGDVEALARAVRSAVPLLPREIARSYALEACELGGDARATDALVERLVARATALVGGADGEPAGTGDAFVYRDAGRLVQFHVVPLCQYDALTCERVAQVVPLCGEVAGGARTDAGVRAFTERIASLRARVEKRLAALESERIALERERDDAASRDALRRAGELLYAHLADVPARATRFVPSSAPEVEIALDPDLDAKANAAAIFKRYRKATAKLEHLERRLAQLEIDLAYGRDLAWELERADPSTLAESLDDVERFEKKRAARARAAAPSRVRRKPLEIVASADARIYVGRSPRENAEVTFKLGRPDDLWFHARGIPSAHVVLHLDRPRAPEPHELELAAALAAYHSKARASERVEVDYTERKYVRKAAGGAPGQVWYTNARTLNVRPQAGERESEPAPLPSA